MLLPDRDVPPNIWPTRLYLVSALQPDYGTPCSYAQAKKMFEVQYLRSGTAGEMALSI